MQEQACGVGGGACQQNLTFYCIIIAIILRYANVVIIT